MTDTTNDRDAADLVTRLAQALLSEPGSDARAGLGSLVREIETVSPGFIDRLNATNVARRLGLRSDTTRR
jgi:hypothetical protein